MTIGKLSSKTLASIKALVKLNTTVKFFNLVPMDAIATAKAVRRPSAIHLRSHLVSNQTQRGVCESDS